MPSDTQIKDIRWALEEMRSRQALYQLYSAYYAGDHRLMIDQTRLRTIFGRLFRTFRLNLCSAVVDSLADRLIVQSFSSEAETAAQEAQDIWKENRMHRQAGEIHQVAISTGDSYVLVWPDANQNPIIYPQSTLEVCVGYDREVPGKVVKAAKLWKEMGDEPRHRLNLYYPDRIEKYTTRRQAETATFEASAFEEYTEDAEPWPLPNQYGEVPVFHFANNTGLGKYGISELRDAVPIQDWMNYSVFSLLVGQEFQAFPQRYAVGVEVPKDDEGNAVSPFKNGPEKVWALEGDGDRAATVGQLAPANLDQLVNVKQEISLSMAQATATPTHYFTLPSGLVSGESQKTAEQKLDSKVTDRTQSFGDTWSAVMSLAVRMRSGGAMDGLELDCNWKDTKPRNEPEEWAVAVQKEDLGVSRRQVLREQGYTDEQIDKFIEERGEDSLGQVPEATVPQMDVSF